MALSYLGTPLKRSVTDLSRVQPPDAENRMSGGVEGLRGEIPVSPSDPFFDSLPLKIAKNLLRVGFVAIGSRAITVSLATSILPISISG